MKKIKLLWFAATMCLSVAAVAQGDSSPENWFNLDPASDGVQGVGTEKLYNSTLLSGRQPRTVIVAVIDSGVDAEHEDLQNIMWINPGEVPGDGIDNDGNGYVDDVHGWNFIGGKDGKNVNQDTYEMTRLYAKYKSMYDGVDRNKLSKKEKKEYDLYQQIKKDLEKTRSELQGNVDLYTGLLKAVEGIQKKAGKEDLTLEDLENMEATDPVQMQALGILKNVLSNGGTAEELKEQLNGGVEYFSSSLEYGQNPDFDPRSIVGDNYADSDEHYYGNNDVEGPDASHGTHVAGIIAAQRGNGIGMDGVANHVRIMSVRAVPDGDERDKDVANAIRYAVDNGATVINMSFGKGYSWDKGVVDEAVKYAMKKDVLLVHAAGNSGQDNDTADNFPNDEFEKRGLFGPKKAKNWLEVGALSWKGGEKAPANFSNYGKDKVDVFAPGVDILSTTPDNGYAKFSGTSMASPVTAGVAAVLRSYFPELTAEQVKEVIMESVDVNNDKVLKPGSKEKVPFSDLSVTGGIVNVYKAVELASQTKGKKKVKGGAANGGGGQADEAKKAKKDQA